MPCKISFYEIFLWGWRKGWWRKAKEEGRVEGKEGEEKGKDDK
jgi:hypothetical protein